MIRKAQVTKSTEFCTLGEQVESLWYVVGPKAVFTAGLLIVGRVPLHKEH
jgi:hypothetical protein